MKLSFIFTDTPHLKGLSKYDIYQTHFEIPDEALQLADCEARLLTIAETVGQLTHATLHLTCKEMGWKQKLIKVGNLSSERSEQVSWNYYVMAIVFERRSRSTYLRSLKVLAPIETPFNYWYQGLSGRESRLSLSRGVMSENVTRKETPNAPAENAFIQIIERIRDAALPLLALDPKYQAHRAWKYRGFHPYLQDSSLMNLFNSRGNARRKAQTKSEREALKLAQKAEKAEQSKKGRVYFIQQGETGAIKIGYSTTPEKRLQSLKTASPFPLFLLKIIEGGKNLEKELHQRFAALHIGGEWFKSHDDLLAYIDELVAFQNE